MEKQERGQLVFTVDEVAKMLTLSRHSVYEGIRTGQLPAIRIGRRLLIPRAALERMLGGKRRDGTDDGI